MDYLKATKAQLLQIALHEECDIEHKYRACVELQYRYIPEELKATIIYEIGKGKHIEEIAEDEGLTEGAIIHFLRSFSQKHKGKDTWKIGYKQGLKNIGRRVS